jgi:hypothetical protein
MEKEEGKFVAQSEKTIEIEGGKEVACQEITVRKIGFG